MRKTLNIVLASLLAMPLLPLSVMAQEVKLLYVLFFLTFKMRTEKA